MNKYLRSFIIGSSFPVFILYFLAVRFNTKNNVYTFNDYVFIAPFALGLFNMISHYVADIYNIHLRKRLFISSIIAPIVVFLFDYITKQYKIHTIDQWLLLYVNLCIIYFIVFNFIVYYLEVYV
jgi:hypothetical protein